MTRFVAAMFLVMVAGGGSLLAAEAAEPRSLLGILPEDGAWSRFAVTIEEGGAEYQVHWVTRSVGRLVHQDRPCRWIELEQQSESLIYPPRVYRLLIPEEAFGPGKNPTTAAIKIWVREKTGGPRVISSIAAYDERLAAVLEGPDANLARASRVETVSADKKTYSCDRLTGDRQTRIEGFGVRMEHSLLLCADVPFGIAGSTLEVFPANGDQIMGRVTSTLEAAGDGAVAALPDAVP